VNLEFFIKLREMVSSGLVKMADTARKTSNTVKGANGTLAQSFDEIKRKVNDLESAISKSNSVKFIREARKELGELQRMAARAPGNLSGAGGFFGGLANSVRGVLPALGLAGAMALGGNVLEAGLQGQARQTSFEVMAGKSEGTRLNKDLTKFAQDSIYGNEVYQNAQTMLAFGANSKEIMPDMKMIGDIAMGDKDKLGRLTLAFSQVRAAGKLMGQDLLQFVNAGFNPLQVISEKTGLSLGVLRKKVEEGAISFDMVKSAFQVATGEGGRFFDMTNKIAQTDFGKWEAFKGQLAGVALQIGGAVAPAFGWLITYALAPMVSLLSQSVEWIKENSAWLTPLAIGIATATAAYGLYIAVMNAGTIATTLMSGAMSVLNFIMSLNPVGAVIAAIAALVAVVIYAWNKFDGFRGTILGMWEVMKGFGTMIKDYVIDKFKALLTLAGGLASALAKLFKGDFGGAWDTAKTAVSSYGDSMSAARGRAQTTFGNSVKSGLAVYANEKGKKVDEASAMQSAATPGSAKFSSAFSGVTDDSTARGITGGGPRVININGVKFAEKIEIHTTTLEKGLDGIKDQLDEYLLRLLNSGAAVQ
jgi:tape measure domain-containing protein